jgi:hypothetical protein
VSDTRAAAKNLEAIQAAVVRHNGNCPSELEAIEMHPYEVDRLGWDDFRGTPIRANDEVAKGAFRLVCSGDHGAAPAVQEEARELVTVGAPAEREETTTREAGPTA